MISFIISLFEKDRDPIGLITLGLRNKYYDNFYPVNKVHASKIYCYDYQENPALKSFAYFSE